MARSLSLAAYLAYARRAPHAVSRPDQTRPDGRLVWCHAINQQHADFAQQLAERLGAQRPGLCMLLTSREKFKPTHPLPRNILWQPLPEDTVAEAEMFLKHWRPDLCLWMGGDLQPAILSNAESRGVPLYLIDANEDMLTRRSWRWFPDLPRSILGRFSMIMARTSKSELFIRRLGVKDVEMAVTGPLFEGARPLHYNEKTREELAVLLRSRPVWLAAHLQPEELDTVLEANRAISRLSHRNLLVISPSDPAGASVFSEALKDEGLRFITWSEGDMPEETTQVILADTKDELGLWYGLAPISFMGSSLVTAFQGSDPNEPAAHGSAILYGPSIRRYLNTYSRFAEAGAARIIRDATTLAAAVQRLMAADQSAAMAHAAWDVSSQSAVVTDQLTDLVQDTLDVVEAT